MPKITIDAPRTGIAQSPHVGFADMRNLDIESVPGIVRLNNILTKKSGTTVVNTPQWAVINPATPAEIYVLDSGGKVYKSVNSGGSWALMTGFGTTGAAGQGLVLWKNYLFVFRAAAIDVCGDGTATGITNANWSNDWDTIGTDSLWHPAIISKNDGNIYFGCGRYVGMIMEASGQTFAPGTGATYAGSTSGVAADNSLDLPQDYRIKCLAELGNDLMIGTWQGAAVDDIRIADIFPWDRSATSFKKPIEMQENGVHALLNIGNSLIVLAGIDGKVYRCDGYNSYVIGQIPQSIADISGGKYLEFYPGALMNYKNRVFFGVGGTSPIDGMGIWSIMQTRKGSILNLEHGISTENWGASAVLKVSALLPVSRDELLAGWRDDTTYGIDKTTNTSYIFDTATLYGGYFITPLYTVGTNLQKAKFIELEFMLARLLRTGEGIKVEYRLGLTASWTAVKTFAFSGVDVGAVRSDNVITELPNDIKTGEMIQLRISLLGTNSTTPELKHIILQ